MKKRFTFQCWSCQKTYPRTLEITDQQEIIVIGRYCNAEAVVDLRPYRKKIKTVMRGKDNNKPNREELQLPDILPSRKPE